MSDLANIQGLGAAKAVQSVASQRQPFAAAPGQPEGNYDTVEISFMADMLNRIRELPDMRYDKVASVRRAIMNGTYDFNSKLEVAVDRMVQDLG